MATDAAAATLVVPSRRCGPPASGNGGWVSGALAAHVPEPGPAEVTLRRPPPLDRPLLVRPRAGGPGVALLDEVAGQPALVAEAVPTLLDTDDLGVPEPPGPEEARRAELDYPGLERHPFPTCFVCGTAREPGDGLRLQPGPLGDGRFACTWDPRGWAGAGGRVPEVLVWAVLDCPGGWSAITTTGRTAVLGRYAVRRVADVPATGPLLVTAWSRGAEGRKAYAGSALHDPDGRLLAAARATWLTVDLS